MLTAWRPVSKNMKSTRNYTPLSSLCNRFSKFTGSMGQLAMISLTCKIMKKKGPDNPTRQLLPIMSTKCCSGDGERMKDKGGGGGSRSKTKLCVWPSCMYVKDGVCVKVVCERERVTKLVCNKVVCERWKMVCDKVVCERWCDTKWCVTKPCVKNGVGQRWCVKEGMSQMVCDKVVWKMVCQRWCVKDGVWQSGVRKMVCDKVVCDKAVR